MLFGALRGQEHCLKTDEWRAGEASTLRVRSCERPQGDHVSNYGIHTYEQGRQ